MKAAASGRAERAKRDFWSKVKKAKYGTDLLSVILSTGIV